jgi:hypothetical protein
LKTILCLSSYYKGADFLIRCKQEGYSVVLVTLESLLGKPWPREHLEEVFGMPSLHDRNAVINAVSYLARTRDICRVAALDDYDVETAALLREHLRVPGMGESTARYFRDKLAMRARAKDRGILVPDFVGALNHERIAEFFRTVPTPWLLKPRSEASSIGIKKLQSADEGWAAVHELGDRQSHHLIERMIPGDVLHVDSIVWDKKVIFAEAHRYRRPLFDIWNSGGIFATRTVPRGGELEGALLDMHERVVTNLGYVRGVTHTEYILGRDDGRLYFLETAARVGGVHISDLVEASTGLNLWSEWARIELAQDEGSYSLPSDQRRDYAGLIVSLAKDERPDTSAYTDPEIAWRMDDNPFHVGLIVRASTAERVEELLTSYEHRFAQDFAATLPPAQQAHA